MASCVYANSSSQDIAPKRVRKEKRKKKKSTPIGVFGRPRIDRGVPFLLPMVLGSRQVGVLWGFK